MKTMLIIAMCLFSFSVFAQTKRIDLDSYRAVWYDSLHSAKKSVTIDMQMKYPTVSVVLQNKSATITDTVKLYSVTKGYSSVRPFPAIDFAVAGMWLKDSVGTSISSNSVITIPPNTAREYVVVNFAIQLLEFRLLNTNANAKLYFYTKGVKQSQDWERD